MADNFKLVEPDSGTTFKAKEVSSVKYPGHINYDETGTPIDFATNTAIGNVVTQIGNVVTQIDATETAITNAIGNVETAVDTLTSANHIDLVALLTDIVLAAGTNLIGKVGIDQTTPGTTNAVTLTASNNKVGAVYQTAFSAAFTTLTRPANTDAYSANDSISNSATAESVTALTASVSDGNDQPVFLSEVLLDTNDTGLANGTQVMCYLYNQNPTLSSGVQAGDNAAFSNKKAGFIGTMTGTFVPFYDGGKARCVPTEGHFIITQPFGGSTTVWIQYQALEAFTPSANSTTIDARIKGWHGRA